MICRILPLAFCISTVAELKAESRSETFKPVQLKLKSLGSIHGTHPLDWWQARTAHVPGENPFFVTTMSQTGKTGTHDFRDILQSISRDGGRTWSEQGLSRR